MFSFPSSYCALILACGMAAHLRADPVGGKAAAGPVGHVAMDAEALRAALEPMHAGYDSEARMLRRPFSSPGYHTTLSGGTVHSTRDSLQYAVALLDTGDPELLARASGVLDAVIRLQDQDPASKTHGIWPWFLEEPLARMSPPDWNWADFCGVQLLQVARNHKARLTPELANRVDESIRHAVASIRKRNVGPGYTNIALMGTYVTLVASELTGDQNLHEYAMQRLRAMYDHTKQSGAFTEYNSPTYTMVALREIARMKDHVSDPDARPLIDFLYRRAWEEIAWHFHAPSRQWSGPHSRCYQTLLPRQTLGVLEKSTGLKLGASPTPAGKLSLEDRQAIPCPPDLLSFFAGLDAPRVHRQVFIPGARPVIGTTWLAPEFSLGSVNRGDLWNQRRPLVAYWPEMGKPASLRVRFLNNGYDFAAAKFHSSQKQGNVLAGIAFSTDGGNRHVSLDKFKDATIRSSDLRLRFEFGGAAAHHSIPVPATVHSPVLLQMGGLDIILTVPFAKLGQWEGNWEVTRTDDGVGLDLVFFHGPESAIRLDTWQTAAIGLSIAMRPASGAAMSAPTAKESGGKVALDWPQASLGISFAAKPDTGKVLDQAFVDTRPE